VLAHTGQALAPHDLWGAWNLDPVLLVGLAAAGWAYRRGVSRRRSSPALTWRDRCFVAGLIALAVALVSPLDAVAGVLASAHMVQHVLLVLVAAPLLALSRPTPTLLRGSPPLVRQIAGPGHRELLRRGRSVLRSLRHPATAWLLHVGALWFWHAAGPYDAAVDNHVLHVLEHATFLVTGVLFWRVVITTRDVDRTPYGLGILLVFAMGMQSTFLSALLTFAREPWYSAYAVTTDAWGLDPLADQQLAGVVMWIPAGLVYVGAGLGLLVLWMRAGERAALPAPGVT
jgi:putative membrane protein